MPQRRLPIWRMVQIAARWYRMTPEQVRSKARHQRLQPPRRAVALVATEQRYTFDMIARAMNRSDHTTIHHARGRALYFLPRDERFAGLVHELREIAEEYAAAGDIVCKKWFEAEGAKAVVPLPVAVPDDAAPVPPFIDDEDADAFADWPRPDDQTVGSLRLGSIALLAAIRREHPERCAA